MRKLMYGHQAMVNERFLTSARTYSTNFALFLSPVLFNHRKRIFAGLLLFSIFLTLYTYTCLYGSARPRMREKCRNCGLRTIYTGYHINTSTCKIADMGAFNEQVMPYYEHMQNVVCAEKGHLTYVERQDEHYVLRINETLLSMSSVFPVSCCYSNISRFNTSQGFRDWKVSYSKCHRFKREIKIHHDVIEVKCYTIFRTIYQNVYALLHESDDVTRKIRKFNSNDTNLNKNQTFGVTIIGIDSMSTYNLQRTMPKTYSFVEDASNKFLALRGYNKIGDNTLPNMLAILSCYTYQDIYSICKLSSKPMVNEYLIWHNFSKAGYVTAYAEDWGIFSTFNYARRGFNQTPTDYYFQPYFLAADNCGIKKVEDVSVCSGPESPQERMFKIIEEFSIKFQNIPTFSLFWMSEITHENVNGASVMDADTTEFLKRLLASGALKNTFLIFLSDHGFRFGSMRNTYAGWLEERLPFFYILFPERFKEMYPLKYANFLTNTKRLTTPYDIHMMLQEILALSDRTYVIKPCNACKSCHSLFSEAREDRTCQDASIPDSYCTCLEYKSISTGLPIVKKAEVYAIDVLNNLIESMSRGEKKCAVYSLRTTFIASMTNFENSTKKLLVLTFETKPKANFEVTLSVANMNKISNDSDIVEPVFMKVGDISRTDRYDKTSGCVRQTSLEKYCYCI